MSVRYMLWPCVCLFVCQSIYPTQINWWLEFAGLENDRPSKNRVWNLQDWNITDEVAGEEIAGLENDGLENDGVEQEQTYILHTKKNFNVYNM